MQYNRKNISRKDVMVEEKKVKTVGDSDSESAVEVVEKSFEEEVFVCFDAGLCPGRAPGHSPVCSCVM